MAKQKSISFTDEAYEVLSKIAKRKNKSMSEVIRDALALDMWFDETRDQGGHILVERSGTVREVVPRKVA